jgi:hypothetical protein
LDDFAVHSKDKTIKFFGYDSAQRRTIFYEQSKWISKALAPIAAASFFCKKKIERKAGIAPKTIQNANL